LQVPTPYFKHFIYRLGCQVDSIRSVSHKRPPTYARSTTRVSYKEFDFEKFADCIHEQSVVTLKESVLFSGTNEIVEANLTLDEEIEAAMRRDPWSTNTEAEIQHNMRATLHSSMEIGEGEGRATREIEIIWWPDLFKLTQNGQLTLRFFLKKISL
jgi:hypothetical protein